MALYGADITSLLYLQEPVPDSSGPFLFAIRWFRSVFWFFDRFRARRHVVREQMSRRAKLSLGGLSYGGLILSVGDGLQRLPVRENRQSGRIPDLLLETGLY